MVSRKKPSFHNGFRASRRMSNISCLVFALVVTLLYLHSQYRIIPRDYGLLEVQSIINIPSDPSNNPTPASPIPQKLWFKLGPAGLNENTRQWTSSCIDSNPLYNPTFFNDTSADEWVSETFSSSHPSLVSSYLSLKVPILKADILRYLILYVEGGVWLDLDVSCRPEYPISSWIPSHLASDANMVVGWEVDYGYHSNMTRQFASWTIMSRPAVPHMWAVIDDILKSIQGTMAEHNLTSAADVELNMVGDVVDYTGSRRLTRSALRSVGEMLQRPVDYNEISNLTEPMLLGDLLILPGYAFAALMNYYTDVDKIGPELVQHHYAGP